MTRNAYLLAGLIWLKFALVAAGIGVATLIMNDVGNWRVPALILLAGVMAGVMALVNRIGNRLGEEAADQLFATNRRAALTGAVLGGVPAASILIVLMRETATRSLAEFLTAALLVSICLIGSAGAAMLYRDGRITDEDTAGRPEPWYVLDSIRWKDLPDETRRAAVWAIVLIAIAWAGTLGSAALALWIWPEAPVLLVQFGAMAVSFLSVGSLSARRLRKRLSHLSVQDAFFGGHDRALNLGVLLLGVPLAILTTFPEPDDSVAISMFCIATGVVTGMLGRWLWHTRRQDEAGQPRG